MRAKFLMNVILITLCMALEKPSDAFEDLRFACGFKNKIMAAGTMINALLIIICSAAFTSISGFKKSVKNGTPTAPADKYPPIGNIM